MKLGAQLFTVRQHCKTLEDLSQSLKKVADIGYKYVQVSGVCEYDPEWMKAELDKNGLTCVLTHTAGQKLLEETEAVMQHNKILDCKYVGIGKGLYELNSNKDGYTQFVEEFNPIAKTLKDNGFYFMYHNHNLEFARHEGENITVFEKLLQDFDSSIFGVTLDTYWVQISGGNVSSYIRKLKGRVPCIHLKDLALQLNGERCCDCKPIMAPVGWGNMDFDAIIEASLESGVEYALVEQDNCYGEDPFDCLKKSYDYLTSRYEFDF